MTIAELRPYPNQCKSTIPWLPSLPAHWSIRRAKTLFREIDRRTSDGRQPLLSLRMHAGLVDHHASGGKIIPPSALVGYKRVLPGELVMNRMRAAIGLFAGATTEGLVSPDYAVFQVAPTVTVPYAVHLFRTPIMGSVFRMESRGLGTGESGFLRLYSDRFGMLPIPLPPAGEQEAIVRFLDHANRRIDRFIRAKKKLIALLNEQKQAIIHRAVTQGLDPTVLMKDSGVPWLGEVPAHWDVIPLGRLCTARCDGPFGSGLKSVHYTDSGVRVVRLQNIGSDEFRNKISAYISLQHYATLGDHGVVAGDLLIAGLGDEKVPAGRACVAPDNLGLAMVKADCFRFRLKQQKSRAEYLAAHLSSTAPAATACLSSGATRLRINLAATASRTVSIPPESEIFCILTYMNKTTAPIQRVIHENLSKIELIREYRTRLIADVVTGQLDVREAVKGLPGEDADGGEPVDAGDEIDEAEIDGSEQGEAT